MMKRLFQSLRRLFIVALVGVFISVGTFTGKAAADTPPVDTCTLSGSSQLFRNPPFAYADKGPITLNAALGKIQLDKDYDGYLYKATYYNAEGNLVEDKTPQYTLPTIVVSPGNSIDLTLTNNLPINVQLAGELPPTEENLQNQSQDTNLHYHGFNVSPLLGSDDVVMHVHSKVTPNPVNLSPGDNINTENLDSVKIYSAIEEITKLEPSAKSSLKVHESENLTVNTHGDIYPGDNPKSPIYGSIAEYRMQVNLPKGHQSGLFWYHPHAHTVSNNQVRAGMSGGIIVNGIEESYRLLDPKDGIKLNPEYRKTVDGKLKGQNEWLDYPIDSQPNRLAIIQKVMLFKDFNNVLDPKKDQMNCFTLNGEVNPRITIQSGEVQLWRIGNIGADQYMNLALETDEDPLQFPEDMFFYILARDGNVVSKPIKTHSVLLPPASRVELLVVGGKSPKTYNLVSDLSSKLTEEQQKWVKQESQLQYYNLATVEVGKELVTYLCPDGSPLNSCTPGESGTIVDYITSQKPVIIDDILPDPEKLAKYDYCKDGDDHTKCITPGDEYSDPLTQKRTFTFNTAQLDRKTEIPENNKLYNVFTINDKLYNENRIDKVSHLGDIEEWQVVNNADAPHSFHMHQLDFLVTQVTLKDNPGDIYDNYNVVNGKCEENSGIYTCPLEPQGYRDTINLPPNSTTTIRIPFLNPFITGVFVYHCHILDHEDKGMMQNLKVIDPKNYESTSGLAPKS